MRYIDQWLSGLGLEYIIPKLKENGITTPKRLAQLTLRDMYEVVGVEDAEDRKKLYYLIQRLQTILNKDQGQKSQEDVEDDSENTNTKPEPSKEPAQLQRRASSSKINTASPAQNTNQTSKNNAKNSSQYASQNDVNDYEVPDITEEQVSSPQRRHYRAKSEYQSKYPSDRPSTTSTVTSAAASQLDIIKRQIHTPEYGSSNSNSASSKETEKVESRAKRRNSTTDSGSSSNQTGSRPVGFSQRQLSSRQLDISDNNPGKAASQMQPPKSEENVPPLMRKRAPSPIKVQPPSSSSSIRQPSSSVPVSQQPSSSSFSANEPVASHSRAPGNSHYPISRPSSPPPAPPLTQSYETDDNNNNDNNNALIDMAIRVVVRKRPISRIELQRGDRDVMEMKARGQVIVHEPKIKVDLTKVVETQSFFFDDAFEADETNELIYSRTMRHLVSSVFEGGKASCFAYGQTGSGKTFTMMGSKPAAPAEATINAGLYVLAARDVFSLITQPQYRGLQVYVSCFEIYGGKLYDLLNERGVIKCLENSKQQVQLPGLTEHLVKDVPELLEMMGRAHSLRSTGSTGANLESSRSHQVLQIVVKGTLKGNQPPPAAAGLRKNNINVPPPKIQSGKLSFIDLAGSERGADTTHNSKQTRMEGAEINTSLLALKEVIRSLEKKQGHTPFRGSKLTQVLKDSFIGDNTRTCMVACVSPSNTNCEHTLNTLRYADRVKEHQATASGAAGGGAGVGLKPVIAVLPAPASISPITTPDIHKALPVKAAPIAPVPVTNNNSSSAKPPSGIAYPSSSSAGSSNRPTSVAPRPVTTSSKPPIAQYDSDFEGEYDDTNSHPTAVSKNYFRPVTAPPDSTNTTTDAYSSSKSSRASEMPMPTSTGVAGSGSGLPSRRGVVPPSGGGGGGGGGGGHVRSQSMLPQSNQFPISRIRADSGGQIAMTSSNAASSSSSSSSSRPQSISLSKPYHQSHAVPPPTTTNNRYEVDSQFKENNDDDNDYDDFLSNNNNNKQNKEVTNEDDEDEEDRRERERWEAERAEVDRKYAERREMQKKSKLQPPSTNNRETSNDNNNNRNTNNQDNHIIKKSHTYEQRYYNIKEHNMDFDDDDEIVYNSNSNTNNLYIEKNKSKNTTSQPSSFPTIIGNDPSPHHPSRQDENNDRNSYDPPTQKGYSKSTSNQRPPYESSTSRSNLSHDRHQHQHQHQQKSQLLQRIAGLLSAHKLAIAEMVEVMKEEMELVQDMEVAEDRDSELYADRLNRILTVKEEAVSALRTELFGFRSYRAETTTE